MKKYIIGFALFVGGMLALGGVNGFFAYTNTTEFCTSCHTMQWNYEDYKETKHFKNRVGVKAECADCHVPKEFFPKVAAKIIAVKDIYHQILGTVDTQEKFEAHRWDMANRVWDKMKATDSRECRTFHDYQDMDFSVQGRSARSKHEQAPMRGKTCIECHQGIVHHMPEEPYDEEEYAEEDTSEEEDEAENADDEEAKDE
jgi:cytochrome c-type protein NapC